jgi:hypothetical protein
MGVRNPQAECSRVASEMTYSTQNSAPKMTANVVRSMGGDKPCYVLRATLPWEPVSGKGIWPGLVLEELCL